jgi:hypothetical protein
MVCHKPPTCKEIRVIPNFWWSGVKLPICLLTFLLAITCVSSTQMGHASPFYTSMFQELSNDMNNYLIQWVLTPWNCILRIWKSIGTPTPKVGVHLGVWKFISSHFPTLPGAWNVIPRLHFWLASLQVFALVANPKLGLQHVYTWHKSKMFLHVQNI